MAVYVLDTNVLVAGSGDSSMSPQCQLEALRFLLKLRRSSDRVAVDHLDLILRQYRNNLNQSPNQQSPGFELYKVLQSEGRFDYCQIDIDEVGTPILPEACLIHDPSDRVFIAVALIHEENPPIYNVSDEDWIEDELRLRDCKIVINHICEGELRAKVKAKL